MLRQIIASSKSHPCQHRLSHFYSPQFALPYSLSTFTTSADSKQSTDDKKKELKRKLAEKGPPPSFKYFINRSTVLGVYREALQLCKSGFSNE